MRRIVIMLTVFILSLPSFSAFAEKPEVGKAAPSFRLRDLQNKPIRLTDFAYVGEEKAYKKKKAVLLDFFRTDCKPCIKELKYLKKFHAAFHDKVQVLLIALHEKKEGEKKLKTFLSKHQFSFPVLIDAYNYVAKLYISDGDDIVLPSMVFISPDGVIEKRLEGLSPSLIDDLEALVNKKKDDEASKEMKPSVEEREGEKEIQEKKLQD